MTGMLSGVRVISLNHFLMGPLAAQVLADLGADVVMVEPPEGGFQRRWSGANSFLDGVSLLFLCANRNKRSLAVDLKTEAGRDVVRRLAAGADVVMENYRPGVMDRLGLGYDDLKPINPRLIYASASGWGGSGPLAQEAGQDLLMQATSGLMSVTGFAGTGPTPASTTTGRWPWRWASPRRWCASGRPARARAWNRTSCRRPCICRQSR